MNYKIKIACVAVLLVLVMTMFAGCSESGSKKITPPGRMTDTSTYTGYCGDPQYGTEPSTQKVSVSVGSNATGKVRVVEATFTLTWIEDAADGYAPEDTFTMTVGNETVTGNTNKLTFTIKDSSFSTSMAEEGTVFDSEGLGTSFEAEISIADCGFEKAFLFGFLIHPDHGNSFTLTVDGIYYTDAAAEE